VLTQSVIAACFAMNTGIIMHTVLSALMRVMNAKMPALIILKVLNKRIV
jgi:hypothetical protein